MAQPQSDDFDRLVATAGIPDADESVPAGTETPAQGPPTVDEQMAEIRKIAEDAQTRARSAEEEAGRLRGENQTLRSRLDSREAMGYRPAVDDGTGKPPDLDALTKFLTDGLDENERSMPTASTMVKIVARAAPLYDQRITDRLTDHEARKAMDDEFFEYLASRWSTSQRTYRPKDLRTRHGTLISQIARDVLMDPGTRDVRLEYKNNSQAAFTKIAEALERTTNQIVEDVPRARPPQRLSTGDGAGSRLATPAAPRDAAQRELDSMYRYNTGR